MQQSNDTLIGFIIAVGLHAALLLVLIFSGLISKTAVLPESKGEPVQASVMISAADIRRAQKSIRESEAAPPPKTAKAVQPKPEPSPQTAETPQQTQAQAPVINPDSVDQQRINKLAVEQTKEQIVAEQEARRRQAQIDLTDDIKKQQQAENKQRMREQTEAQLAAIRLSREAAAKESRRLEMGMDAQRDRQLADLQRSAPVRSPPGPTQVQSGNPAATQKLLMSQYINAIKAAIQANWRQTGARAMERCQIEFTQTRFGDVIDVTIRECAYSEEGKEFAKRAVQNTQMPYKGFEEVWQRNQTFTFCYPNDQCEK